MNDRTCYRCKTVFPQFHHRERAIWLTDWDGDRLLSDSDVCPSCQTPDEWIETLESAAGFARILAERHEVDLGFGGTVTLNEHGAGRPW